MARGARCRRSLALGAVVLAVALPGLVLGARAGEQGGAVHGAATELLPRELTRTRGTTSVLTQFRCVDHSSPLEGEQRPVKVVVFDLDETLTLSTFMSNSGSYTPEQLKPIAEVNFESPWVNGSRADKLHRMFERVATSNDETRRPLAVLTKNSHAQGVQAVLNLLSAAGFEAHFDAIWHVPPFGKARGAYKNHRGEWVLFVLPMQDHKANVLSNLGANPKAWFPQLDDVLPEMVMENIVLVDDDRRNFQSADNTKVLRWCLVAKYCADYRDKGHVDNMGGIGAHDDHDYEALQLFVETPWSFKQELDGCTVGYRCCECTHEKKCTGVEDKKVCQDTASLTKSGWWRVMTEKGFSILGMGIKNCGRLGHRLWHHNTDGCSADTVHYKEAHKVESP